MMRTGTILPRSDLACRREGAPGIPGRAKAPGRERLKAGGMAADDPTVAAIAALVADQEGLLEPPVAEAERPQVQLTLTPSAWRAGTRPRIRQLGGQPKW